MAKVTTAWPLNDMGMNELRIPRNSNVIGVKASINNHHLFLHTVHDTSEQEVGTLNVAVIASGQPFEAKDNLQFIGSEWVKDILCHVFIVTPAPQADKPGVGTPNTGEPIDLTALPESEEPESEQPEANEQ